MLVVYLGGKWVPLKGSLRKEHLPCGMLICPVWCCVWTSGKASRYSSWTSSFRLFSLSHYGFLLPLPSPSPCSLVSLEVVWGSGDICQKEKAAGYFLTHCCSSWRHCRWPDHDGICSSSAEQFVNDILLALAHLKLALSFFLHFQPGCVNTTEVDIKKSSRMRNPHKTRKVNGRVSCGLAPSQKTLWCHKHTSPCDSVLVIPFLEWCKQHLPLLVRPQWQTKVPSTRVCPGEPTNLLGFLTEHGWKATYRSIRDQK